MAVPKLCVYSLTQAGISYSAGSSGAPGALVNAIPSTYESGCPAWFLNPGATPAKIILNVASHVLALGWLRFQVIPPGNQDANTVYLLLKGAVSSLIRVRATTNSNIPTVQFEFFNGATWTAVGATFSLTAGVYDISWNISATDGYFRLYKAGALQAEYIGDTLITADTTVNTIELGCAAVASFGTTYGSIFVDSVDTRGLYYAVDQPFSAGTYATMTGAFGDVNEYPGETNYTTAFLVADADNEKFTANFGTIQATLSATGVVETVIMFSAGIALSEPALYLKPLLRKSAIDYTPAGSCQLISSRESYVGVQINLDPSTGVAWASAADVHAFEMGFIATTLP